MGQVLLEPVEPRRKELGLALLTDGEFTLRDMKSPGSSGLLDYLTEFANPFLIL